MSDQRSGSVAARSGGKRQKTRHTGVFTREIINRQTNKPDTAFDVAFELDGKKQWHLVGYASEGVNAAFAYRKRAELIADHTTTRALPAYAKAIPTLDEAWEIFKERAVVNMANPADEIRRYVYYIQPVFGHRRIDNITPLDVDGFRAALQGKGLAPASVVKILGDFRRIYKRMVAWGIYKGPVPTDGLAMPKVDNMRTRFLTRDEANTLLAALQKRSPLWHAIAWMSLFTGMRKGEILALRGEHLDFAGGQILIKDAKTGSRTIPMTDEVREFLQNWPRAHPGQYVFKGRDGSGPTRRDSGKVFTRTVDDLCLNAGIKDSRHKVVFHTLRHTFCSWLAQSGVPLYTIGQIVGHTTTQMTQRYAHLCPDTKKQAASHIAAILGGQKG